MAFLDDDLLKKHVERRSNQSHPLLSQKGVELSTRVTYFNGCVMAALIAESKITQAMEHELRSIGNSLNLPEEIISDGLQLESRLVSSDDKNAFIDDLKTALKPRAYANLFMRDFEDIVFDGPIIKSNVEGKWLQFGLILIGDEWKEISKARKKERFRSQAFGGVLLYPRIVKNAITESRFLNWLLDYMWHTNLCHYFRHYWRVIKEEV